MHSVFAVSVVVFIIIIVLVVSEIRYYASSQFVFDYDVDSEFQGSVVPLQQYYCIKVADNVSKSITCRSDFVMGLILGCVINCRINQAVRTGAYLFKCYRTL